MMAKNYQYILLDWDGNLAKTLDLWLRACRVPLEKRGLKLTDEDIAGSFGHLRSTWEPWGIGDTDAAIGEADVIAQQDLPNVELYPDALEVLEELYAAGKRIALITSSSHGNTQHLLQKYNIARFFHAIVASDDVEHHKPHPEPLERALSLLGGIKTEAVMIGDSDKDLGAANNARVDSILFYPPEHEKFYNLSKLKQHNPTYIVADFRQVLNIV
jgi:pyrophosphatase PpaX